MLKRWVKKKDQSTRLNPSIAKLIVEKDKWYQIMHEKTRVRQISKAIKLNEIKPTANM